MRRSRPRRCLRRTQCTWTPRWRPWPRRSSRRRTCERGRRDADGAQAAHGARGGCQRGASSARGRGCGAWAHGVQVTVEELAAYVPAGHSAQVAAPAAEKDPAGQATQLAALVAPRVLEAVPAAHGVQLAWPLAAA